MELIDEYLRKIINIEERQKLTMVFIGNLKCNLAGTLIYSNLTEFVFPNNVKLSSVLVRCKTEDSLTLEVTVIDNNNYVFDKTFTALDIL